MQIAEASWSAPGRWGAIDKDSGRLIHSAFEAGGRWILHMVQIFLFPVPLLFLGDIMIFKVFMSYLVFHCATICVCINNISFLSSYTDMMFRINWR
jgi:hypothetical protein